MVILLTNVTIVTLLTKVVTYAQRSECYFSPICRQILVKIVNINFHVNPTGQSRGGPAGHTDGRKYDEGTSRISQLLCEHA
jgi:hypothetical protein